MTKFISSYMHGVLDYLGGVALLLAPNIFGFAGIDGAAESIPRVLGVIMIFQALITDYELGVTRAIPFSMHIRNDYIAGAFLALSPWFFGFWNQPANVWMPHLFVGILLIAVTAVTDPHPRILADKRRL